MDIVAKRIFELVDKKFPEQKAFASAIAVNPKTVSAWRTRNVRSYTKYLPKIAEVLETTTDYLNYGVQPEQEHLTPYEHELLIAYRKADSHTKKMVRLALEPFGLSEPSDKAM